MITLLGKLDLTPLEVSPKLRIWLNVTKQDNGMLWELFEFHYQWGYVSFLLGSPTREPAHGLLKRNLVPISYLR